MAGKDDNFEFNFQGKYTGDPKDKNIGDDAIYEQIGSLRIQLALEKERLEKLRQAFLEGNPKVNQTDIDLKQMEIDELEKNIADALENIQKN